MERMLTWNKLKLSKNWTIVVTQQLCFFVRLIDWKHHRWFLIYTKLYYYTILDYHPDHPDFELGKGMLREATKFQL